MTTPHKHAAVIHAFADGAQVQILNSNGSWVDTKWPDFAEGREYRIKPAAPVVETKMTDKELVMAKNWSGHAYPVEQALRYVANAAIARAIADGQVVPVDQKNYVDRLAFVADIPGMIEAARTKRDMAVALAVKEAVMDAWGRADRPKEYAAMEGVELAAIIAGVK